MHSIYSCVIYIHYIQILTIHIYQTVLTCHVPPIGAVVEILFDAHHLNRTTENLNLSHVSVQDILKELNARLSTVRLAFTKQH